MLINLRTQEYMNKAWLNLCLSHWIKSDNPDIWTREVEKTLFKVYS